jgi:hypothetical protein
LTGEGRRNPQIAVQKPVLLRHVVNVVVDAADPFVHVFAGPL